MFARIFSTKVSEVIWAAQSANKYTKHLGICTSVSNTEQFYSLFCLLFSEKMRILIECLFWECENCFARIFSKKY